MDINNSLIMGLHLYQESVILPQKITCFECGHILYEGSILKSPKDIIRRHEEKCPKCSRILELQRDSITIFPNIQ